MLCSWAAAIRIFRTARFPYQLKEEFDGPPEKVLAELADALVAKGVKEISGDVIGDDSYFPRERYPNGWEIDDMVWEFGAAISSIVVDDNTVTLTLTPGEHGGKSGASGGELRRRRILLSKMTCLHLRRT